MDDYCEYVTRNSYVERFNEDCDGLEVSEILQLESGRLIAERKTIPNDEVVSWLSNSRTQSDSTIKTNTVVRIVYISHQLGFASNVNISHATQELVLDGFQLKRAWSMSRQMNMVSSFSIDDQQRQAKRSFTMQFKNDIHISWTHDLRSSCTDVICGFAESFNGFDMADYIHNLLASSKGFARYPLLMGLVLVTLSNVLHENSFINIERKIAGTESRTQHSGFPDETRVPAAAGSFSSLSATMSGCATSLAFVERDQEVICNMLELLWDDKFILSVGNSSLLEGMALEFDQCLTIARQGLESQVIYRQYLLRRVEIQLNAVCDFLFHFVPIIRCTRGSSHSDCASCST